MLFFVTACSNGEVTPSTDTDQKDEMTTTIESEDIEEDNMDNEEDTPENDEQASSPDTAQNQEDMKEIMEQFNFHEFELEVEYGDKEYEVEIEHHSDGRVEAEVEDELNGIEINDDLEAFNHLLPYVKKLDVSIDMDKQAIIDHVLEVFELDTNYDEFEVEIEFNDGKELEIEDER